MTRLSRRAIRTVANPILFAAGILLVWQVLCRRLDIPRFVLPAPSEIGALLVARWDMILPHLTQTLTTTLSGFVIGISIGFLLGIILGASRSVYRTVFPTLIGLNSIPKAAVVPLLIIWAGLGTFPALITSALIVIFPIAVVVSTSIATMSPELADVMRSLGATRLDTLLKIGVPQAMPLFLGSLKIAISLSFIGTIVAESVAANRGLGYMMMRASSEFDEELVFAGVAVLALLGVSFYLVTVAGERYALGWAFRRGNTT